ncbi:putative general negative regulator of transcription C16C9.04c [Rosa rugosa]|uniref:putative general negative regulator of transcription C16C9.04c n=1 Tax=Rosa rugosa TaxID=74645 RepID=UPI002B414958|nr:putative general negative regulator of transcription C16C9.04c [Rosa rugosa]
MSDVGEQTCPICAEEMDLTDQQLKPCECGYEVCLWCWNHIMEMAEKDGREGRCPLCRTTYDKEKIMRVAANCKAVLVTEVNQKRKQKKPPKGPEAKKHLTDVRVLQRNLAYIIGLPLNLAKEELLKRRDYFGQYGKVLKVSISRTSTGDIQHATNNSCCVYITYSSEYEAARCIQSVHSFVLDGNSLRACFGTTKYCHAWLKNVPCSNADCMYLHDFGSQEDSFSKDELVSAFERSKDLQIIGVTNNLHQRPGKGLPTPVDENSKSKISSAAKPLVKHPLNITRDEFKGSCADEDSRRATPARTSWVMQVAPSLPLGTSAQMPSYQKPETSSDVHALSSGVVSTESSNLRVRSITSEESCEVHFNSLDHLVLTKQNSEETGQVAVSNKPAGAFVDSTLIGITSGHCLSPDKGVDRDIKSTDFISSRNLNCLSPNLSKSLCDNKGSSFATFDPSCVLPKMGLAKYLEGSENNRASIDCNLSSDLGESGIISNILTMNLDAPEGSLTELHNLVNLLGETDKESSVLRVPSSRKMHEKKQSRFSFAQQEDSCDNIWHPPKDYSSLSDLNKDSFIHVESSNLLRSRSFLSPKASATEVPTSIPPGFSVPRRASPPGFSSHGRSRRVDQAFDSSVNHLLQPAAMPTGYSGITPDAELFEPSIFDIGNGILERGRATLSQYNSSQPDARLHMMRQQSTLTQQNLGFHDHFRNTYSSLHDARLLSPQHPNQFQPNPSTFAQSTPQQISDVHVSNSHWVQWNGVKSASDLGISELLRNERLGFNKFIPCYEDTKTRSSYFSDLNSKGFEI